MGYYNETIGTAFPCDCQINYNRNGDDGYDDTRKSFYFSLLKQRPHSEKETTIGLRIVSCVGMKGEYRTVGLPI